MSAGTLSAAGVYQMSAEAYHSDPCSEPSLSSSIAKLLCQSSPAHARQAHPRLNPWAVEEDDEKFDVGTAAHAILLEGVNAVAIIDAKDWRTNAAKDLRDKARAAGKIPLLEKVWDDVDAMVRSTRAQLDAHEDGVEMFHGGQAEQTLIWQEDGGIWCRARLDYLRPGNIDDYKSTKASANPDVLSRTLFGNGWDIQAAFYLRGLKAVTGVDGMFRFACQETYAPYALSVVALGPDAMILAEKKIIYALDLWRECLKKNRWPAYPLKTAYASLPPWIESAWLQKEDDGLHV